MADKKVDAETGELIKEIGATTTLFKPDQEGECPKVLKVHCKPVFNYQSVEFDWVIPYECTQLDLEDMEYFYTKMLAMLVRVSQNAPQKDVSKPVAPVEEPASEKQKEILRNFHIDFKPDITKKQAHALIKKSMDQEIF